MPPLPRLAILTLVATVAMGMSLLIGGTALSWHDVWGALVHPRDGGITNTIVWQLRLPRVWIAAAVGTALALCGAMLQGMLRNPVVDPYLTGVSAGSAAAVAIAILAGVAAPFTPAIGFAAGLGAALLVAALARRGSGIDTNRLILAGVSLSMLFAAIVTLAIVRAQATNYSGAIVAWLAGSMAGRGWRDLAITAPYAAAGVVLAGMVGFIGLIVPHLARRLVGSDARALLPACALVGATLCMLSDAVCRWIVAPAELPLGVLLAFIGVPTFLYLYLRREVAR